LNTKTATPASPDNVLFIAFLILLVWLPLPLGSNRPWAVSMMEIWVFTLTIGWLLLYGRDKVNLTQPFKAAWPILALLAMVVVWHMFQQLHLPLNWLQWLSPESAKIYGQSLLDPPTSAPLSQDPAATYLAALESSAYWCLFALTLLLVNTRARTKILAYTLVFSGLFQACYGSFMTLSGLEWGFLIEKEHYRGVATGTFINRNHLAGYLEMCLATGIGLLLANLSKTRAKNWREWTRRTLQVLLGPKVRLRLYLAMMVIALVLTHSRMGNTAFFASLSLTALIGLILSLGKKHTSISSYETRTRVILFASLIVIDLFIVGAWFGVEKVVERLEHTSAASESRDEVNEYAWGMWQDHLLTGTGGGSFYSAFMRYGQADMGSSFYDHAHNDYLQFGSEYGLIGFIPLSLCVLICFYISLKAQRQRRSALMRGMGFAATMGIISLMIHSTVDFNLQIPANAALFLILMALAWIALYVRD